DAAAIHKDALLERGMPADSLDQFRSLLSKLHDSLSERDKSRTQRMGATTGLRFEEQEGRSVLKVLDALVRRALAGNDALLATWAAARTVRRRVAGASATTSSPAQPATPAATAA